MAGCKLNNMEAPNPSLTQGTTVARAGPADSTVSSLTGEAFHGVLRFSK